MSLTNNKSPSIAVQLVGEIEHPDFRDALELIRATSRCAIAQKTLPEVIVIAQARPCEISQREIKSLQCRWPLAGLVTIAGSWCEGEVRTGRPWPGVRRFYWYEFPSWWRQQVVLRDSGICPDWSRPATDVYRAPPIRKPISEIRNRNAGVIVLSFNSRSIADALADVLRHAGYATVWQPPGRTMCVVRGAVAGIWDGGQLDAREAIHLAALCRTLARDEAAVVALLDFPRRDRCEIAQQLGVAAVVAKPWINADLVATIEDLANRKTTKSATLGRVA